MRSPADLHKLELESLFFDEYDEHDAILSVHAGAGGVDAQDWAEMLARMYQRFLADDGFTVTVEDVTEGEEAGIKSVTMTVRGDHAYGTLEGERGVHRLVRISPFDSNARRQTSFAGVDVVPDLGDQAKVRDRCRRSANRHLPIPGRRWPARQQDRFGGPHHPPPDRDRRRSARTSAANSRTRRGPWRS